MITDRVAAIMASVFITIALLLASPSRSQEDGKKTITREHDPIIVKAKSAGPLVDKPIAGLRVHAFLNGALAPIPFQVDERDKKGDYVFPGGKERNPEDGDGVFNGEDELVIMARDLGERVPELGPLNSGQQAAAELEVKDPIDSAKGWAYVFVFVQDPPERSKTDYVSLDLNTWRIEALYYTLGFSKDAPMAMDTLLVKPAGGGDGVDYCDRLKARLSCKVAGVEIKKTEADFTDEVVAYIDGPVRVVRRTRSRLILFWNVPSPSAKLDNLYYYNSFSFPTEINLPVDVGFVVKDAHFRVSVDSPKLAGQRRYRNSLYPEGVIQDGTMSEAEKKLSEDPRPFNWSSTGTTGPDGKDHGAWFNRLIVQGDNPEWKPRVFYIDDQNHLDPPDQEPGSFGNGGYQISGLTNLSAGTYRLESVMYATPVFEPSMAPLFMRILDQPVVVEVKAAR